MLDNTSSYKLGKELSEQDLMILEAVQGVWQDGSVGKALTAQSWLPEFNPFNPCHEYMNIHTEQQPCFRQGCPEYVKTVIIKNYQSIRGLMKSTIFSIRNRNWQSNLKSPQQLQSSGKGKANHSESHPRQKSRNEDNKQQILASVDRERSVFADHGGVNQYDHMEITLEVSQNIQYETAIWPSYPTPGHVS